MRVWSATRSPISLAFCCVSSARCDAFCLTVSPRRAWVMRMAAASISVSSSFLSRSEPPYDRSLPDDCVSKLPVIAPPLLGFHGVATANDTIVAHGHGQQSGSSRSVGDVVVRIALAFVADRRPLAPRRRRHISIPGALPAVARSLAALHVDA